MTGSTFGHLFRLTTFGESHGPAMGAVIDGCPAGLTLNLEQLQQELDRRRPGQSSLVTQRKEKDEFELLSGLFEGKTTGAPICIMVRNEDVRSKDYEAIRERFRPGHADFTYFAKYGLRDYRGGGRASARETVGRVIGGAVAKQLLAHAGISFRGGVVQIGEIKAIRYDWEQVEKNELRGVDPDMLHDMEEQVQRARAARDSIGGVVEVQALGLPPGLGEPVFGKLDAAVGAAMFSIPAVKGVEIGSGFACAAMLGSQMNDEMLPEGFAANNHGGVLGGLSSGAPVVVRLVLKPTASIAQKRRSLDVNLQPAEVETKGRHDPCLAIRAVPIAEAMLALVVADAWLQQEACLSAQNCFFPHAPVNYRLAPQK